MAFERNRKVSLSLSRDWVAGREPYKGPCKFKPFAKHFLAMNEIPTIDDTSHGMWRRIYIIEFPKTFNEDEMDVFLIDKLKNELSGIFNWAIEGYKRLRDRNFRFKEGRSMKASKQNYIDHANQHIHPHPGHWCHNRTAPLEFRNQGLGHDR
jgi:putative DNA primase/helicase